MGRIVTWNSGAWLAAMALAANAAFAEPPASIGAPAASPPMAAGPARLDYQTATLSNGLKVILLEDHHAPVVTVEVYYHVGSKDEPAGKFGFAHLFEHLMFKGTARVPAEAFDTAIEEVGGNDNADTSFDRTRFYETIPANALDRTLFLEADRMQSLNVDEANFEAERHVVEEELRTDVLNAPYGHALETQLAHLYPAGQPYAHASIGSIPNLESATLADVKAFHDTYYKPDNATLILVGDFRGPDCLTRVRRYFGAIPARGKPFPRIAYSDVGFALASGAQSATIRDALAPASMVTLSYRMPPPAEGDEPVFDVIATILANGHTSRLQRSLVIDQGVSVSPSADAVSLRLGGYFLISTDVVPGKSEDTTQALLLAEVAKLARDPVSQAELDRARNQTLTSLVFETLTTSEVADRLGEVDVTDGTPEQANREFAADAAVTAADIQRVAQKYLGPAQAVTVIITPPVATPPPAATPANVPVPANPAGTAPVSP